jgi:hypothetical protein
VTGIDQCVGLLKNIKEKRARLALRAALGRAATILLQTARPLAVGVTSQATGLLRRSLGKKDSTQFSRSVYSLVGPRRGFKQTISPKAAERRQSKLVRRLTGKGIALRESQKSLRGKVKDPVRYAHLFGGGHKSRGGGHVSGREFLKHAGLLARSRMNEVIKRTLIEKLVDNIQFKPSEG